eukprot:TRINITY_DN102259_c0_g1_i1.p1 TRINITY_DN102259_c0_g1~~TRINITY_DN102259_c0_g1_i1.p1  ORF type:complete len:240 (+),score=33.76 TRINITY_DN102259_c0_g1_i1:72-722(+)
MSALVQRTASAILGAPRRLQEIVFEIPVEPLPVRRRNLLAEEMERKRLQDEEEERRIRNRERPENLQNVPGVPNWYPGSEKGAGNVKKYLDKTSNSQWFVEDSLMVAYDAEIRSCLCKQGCNRKAALGPNRGSCCGRCAVTRGLYHGPECGDPPCGPMFEMPHPSTFISEEVVVRAPPRGRRTRSLPKWDNPYKRTEPVKQRSKRVSAGWYAPGEG